jgi:hypothetical protein
MMKVDIQTSYNKMFVTFDDGILAGMKISFGGEPCVGNALGICPETGKIIEPIERKLDKEEIAYVKERVLEFCKNWDSKRTILWK